MEKLFCDLRVKSHDIEILDGCKFFWAIFFLGQKLKSALLYHRFNGNLSEVLCSRPLIPSARYWHSSWCTSNVWQQSCVKRPSPPSVPTGPRETAAPHTVHYSTFVEGKAKLLLSQSISIIANAECWGRFNRGNCSRIRIWQTCSA